MSLDEKLNEIESAANALIEVGGAIGRINGRIQLSLVSALRLMKQQRDYYVLVESGQAEADSFDRQVLEVIERKSK